MLSSDGRQQDINLVLESGLVYEQTRCRVCNSANFIPVLSFGDQAISDFVDDSSKSPYAGLTVPLILALCDVSKGGCGLLQLKHTVNRQALYSKYWYKSGMNDTMKAALEGIARKAEKVVPLGDGDLVLDIGCNDGTLLRGYTKKLVRVGFEPTTNLLADARVGTNMIINDFWNYDAFARNFPQKRAKCITSIAMFYSIEDPNKFVSDIAKCLDEDGVWIIQMAYLTSMLDTNGFDNVCHEHLEYYGLLSLEKLVERHDLSVVDLELNDIYGGSIRVYIRQKGRGIPKSVAVHDLEHSEHELGLDTRKPYEEFGRRIDSTKKELVQFIEKEVGKGKTVYIYGASTKGNVILQYFGLDHKLIKGAAERNPDKWGKKTVGTMIPIVSEEEARAANPDYFLVLPWPFIEEFKRRERKFLERGGKFIVPLPTVKIIGVSD
jgi:SAM-dependent methyltransferase